MSDKKPVITIGIPCYSSVPPEVLQDYMRFMYYLGRRYQEYDFALAIKSKSEQFRARNAIVEAAYQVDSDYLLMLDDDHIIDTDDDYLPSKKYEFLRKLIEHDKDIIGALYYHRGGECKPVLMNKDENGMFTYLRDDEVMKGLQEVDVQGGGCILIKMKVFDKIASPWFEPEVETGTDIQICTKAKEKGFSVWTDPTIEIGHVISERGVITSRNRQFYYKSSGDASQETASSKRMFKVLSDFRADAMEYLGVKNTKELMDMAEDYIKHQQTFNSYEDKKQYYIDSGKMYFARQVVIHEPNIGHQFGEYILQTIKTNYPGAGIEVGCGCAPITFELARAGHTMHFMDIDGAQPYEFLKWRAKKYNLNGSCVFNQWPQDRSVDYAIFLDSIEHFENWKEILQKAYNVLKPLGGFICNFLTNMAYNNPEHIFMDKPAFMAYMTEIGFLPVSHAMFQKREDLR
jgi:2-polyprenyl-3-methyl-5-hydroxy-6-metoxy-1,4-benzoquinol methylase